jgi:hypothetical protein
MNFGKLHSLSFRRFELGLTRASFHETSILEEDGKNDEENCKSHITRKKFKEDS